MDKSNDIKNAIEKHKKIAAKQPHENQKKFSCVLMFADKNLDQEPLISGLLEVNGALFEFVESTKIFRFVLESKVDGEIASINDHIRSIALACSEHRESIATMTKNSIIASVTYFGTYSEKSPIGDIIDPDVSEFLSSCNLPLFINYGHKA